MGIARSTYYDKPAVSIDDTALVETMAAISDSFEAYGYRRMQAALRHRGFVVSHKKIRRLMREHGLQPRQKRQGAWDTNAVLSSFRLDDAGRLIFGSVGALRFGGQKVRKEWAQRAISRIFPQLPCTSIEFSWFGSQPAASLG
ncbi:IS3 family transposase [Bosea sp. NPDC055594]